MPAQIDIALACTGYLGGPKGKARHIPGLANIAKDAAALGVRAYWDTLGFDEAGFSLPHKRIIVLADWLDGCPSWFLLKVAAHEVAHCYVGLDEDAADQWVKLFHPVAPAILP